MRENLEKGAQNEMELGQFQRTLHRFLGFVFDYAKKGGNGETDSTTSSGPEYVVKLSIRDVPLYDNHEQHNVDDLEMEGGYKSPTNKSAAIRIPPLFNNSAVPLSAQRKHPLTTTEQYSSPSASLANQYDSIVVKSREELYTWLYMFVLMKALGGADSSHDAPFSDSSPLTQEIPAADQTLFYSLQIFKLEKSKHVYQFWNQITIVQLADGLSRESTTGSANDGALLRHVSDMIHSTSHGASTASSTDRLVNGRLLQNNHRSTAASPDSPLYESLQLMLRFILTEPNAQVILSDNIKNYHSESELTKFQTLCTTAARTPNPYPGSSTMNLTTATQYTHLVAQKLSIYIPFLEHTLSWNDVASEMVMSHNKVGVNPSSQCFPLLYNINRDQALSGFFCIPLGRESTATTSKSARIFQISNLHQHTQKQQQFTTQSSNHQSTSSFTICLNEDSISDAHATLEVHSTSDNASPVVYVVPSTQGKTYIDGQLIRSKTRLSHGMLVCFGTEWNNIFKFVHTRAHGDQSIYPNELYGAVVSRLCPDDATQFSSPLDSSAHNDLSTMTGDDLDRYMELKRTELNIYENETQELQEQLERLTNRRTDDDDHRMLIQNLTRKLELKRELVERHLKDYHASLGEIERRQGLVSHDDHVATSAAKAVSSYHGESPSDTPCKEESDPFTPRTNNQTSIDHGPVTMEDAHALVKEANRLQSERRFSVVVVSSHDHNDSATMTQNILFHGMWKNGDFDPVYWTEKKMREFIELLRNSISSHGTPRTPDRVFSSPISQSSMVSPISHLNQSFEVDEEYFVALRQQKEIADLIATHKSPSLTAQYSSMHISAQEKNRDLEFYEGVVKRIHSLLTTLLPGKSPATDSLRDSLTFLQTAVKNVLEQKKEAYAIMEDALMQKTQHSIDSLEHHFDEFKKQIHKEFILPQLNELLKEKAEADKRTVQLTVRLKKMSQLLLRAKERFSGYSTSRDATDEEMQQLNELVQHTMQLNEKLENGMNSSDQVVDLRLQVDAKQQLKKLQQYFEDEVSNLRTLIESKNDEATELQEQIEDLRRQSLDQHMELLKNKELQQQQALLHAEQLKERQQEFERILETQKIMETPSTPKSSISVQASTVSAPAPALVDEDDMIQEAELISKTPRILQEKIAMMKAEDETVVVEKEQNKVNVPPPSVPQDSVREEIAVIVSQPSPQSDRAASESEQLSVQFEHSQWEDQKPDLGVEVQKVKQKPAEELNQVAPHTDAPQKESMLANETTSGPHEQLLSLLARKRENLDLLHTPSLNQSGNKDNTPTEVLRQSPKLLQKSVSMRKEPPVPIISQNAKKKFPNASELQLMFADASHFTKFVNSRMSAIDTKHLKHSHVFKDSPFRSPNNDVQNSVFENTSDPHSTATRKIKNVIEQSQMCKVS